MKNEQQARNNFKATFKKYFNMKDALKLPNILCYLRIILIIVFLVMYLMPITIAGNENAGFYIATAIMATAVYTDFLDGFIARKFDLTSNLGKALDPVADKLTQFSIALAITIKFQNYPSILALLILIFVKESWMFIATVLLARHNRTFGGAKWYGKVSTFLVYVVLGVTLLCGPFITKSFPVDENPLVSHLILDGLASFAILLELFAFVNYIILHIKLMNGAGVDEVSSTDVKDKDEENKSND